MYITLENQVRCGINLLISSVYTQALTGCSLFIHTLKHNQRQYAEELMAIIRISWKYFTSSILSNLTLTLVGLSMPRATAHASHLLSNNPIEWPTFNKIKYLTSYTLWSQQFLEYIKEISYTKTYSRINREGSRLTILNGRQERGPENVNRK